MEKRAILAAVLMAAVFIVYQTFFLLEAPPPTKPPEQAAPAPQAPPTPSAPAAPVAVAPPRPAAPRPAAPRPLQRLTTVEALLYRAVVSSESGKLQDFTLKYRGDKPMVMAIEGLAPEVGQRTLHFHALCFRSWDNERYEIQMRIV